MAALTAFSMAPLGVSVVAIKKIISAFIVDISRLIVYGTTFFSKDFEILKN
ncbi:MAG: hypothetical protein PVG86_02485 [Desulfobacterales bacterium]|jgi:hypothetical protein